MDSSVVEAQLCFPTSAIVMQRIKAGISEDAPPAKPSEMLVRAVAKEAWLAARLLSQFLGEQPRRAVNEARGDPSSPPDLALRAAAALRIAQLEQDQILGDQGLGLPSAVDVLADCLAPLPGRVPKYSGSELIGQIVWIRIHHLSWSNMRGCTADFRLEISSNEKLISAVAALVWKLRDLNTEEEQK